MNFITPILLAGGSGSRLWPSSRKTYPKQFINLINDETLFQQSALRFANSDIVKFKPHITVTNSLFRFIVIEQMEAVGIDPGQILIEPEAKNTAPAIIAATILALKENKDAIMISVPSDHVIPDNKYFNEVLTIGLKEVKNGKIVTFGIKASHPETGYGYLKLDASDEQYPKKVLSFIEKPDFISAKKMLDEGNHLWNSGIFMFRAEDMITAFELYEQEMLSIVKKALDLSAMDMQFIRLDPNCWRDLENISIDYAIMEKAKNIVALAYNSSWSDLGDWNSVWLETEKDKDGVALSQNAHAIECKNSLLRSEHQSQQIIGLGLQNIVAIAMTDAVLVANKNKSQDIRNIVDYLKLKKIPQSENFLKDFRPWGWFEILSLGQGFKVKKIYVKPGGALSLQSHEYRSEHWIIVKGIARITIDNDIKLAGEGQSIYVPLGSIHRLENPSKNPVVIIEVQIGSYLEEDDITRYEDNYSRK